MVLVKKGFSVYLSIFRECFCEQFSYDIIFNGTLHHPKEMCYLYSLKCGFLEIWDGSIQLFYLFLIVYKLCQLHCEFSVLNGTLNVPILGLRSLQLRRLHQDLIYTYKIIFGLVDLDFRKFFLVSPNETTRGHVSKLFVCQSRVDVRKYFLGNRVVKIWNSLPATVEDFASIRKFKSFMERVNLSHYVNFLIFFSFFSVLFIDVMHSYVCCDACQCQRPWHLTWFYQVLNK